MQRLLHGDLDQESVLDAVGATTYSSGAAYARQQAVLHLSWDAADSALSGVVRGQRGHIYTTTAYLIQAGAARLRFASGECSCPVGYDCKHAVALALAAAPPPNPGTATGSAAGAAGVPAPRQPAGQPAARPSAWEKSLEALLGASPASGQHTSGGTLAQGRGTPLAIELTLAPAPRATTSWQLNRDTTARMVIPGPGSDPGVATGTPVLRLMARLVQAGQSGRWVAGNLSWSRLDSLQVYGHPAAQARLLRELFALYRSRDRFGYYYGDEKTIELSAFESRQLWPLLGEAEAAGLRLVYPGKRGDVPGYGNGELCLDATTRAAGGETDQDLIVAPVLVLDTGPAGAVPLKFIGTESHGLVYADAADVIPGADYASLPFKLARLTSPVPAQLRQMALDRQRLVIPPAELARFRDTFYPRLRQAATVISSDGSFTPPVISGPVLVLSASYQAGHELRIGWDWAYQIGDSRQRLPLLPDQQSSGYRHISAERLALAALALPKEEFGLARIAPGPAGPSRELAPESFLHGIETMRFSTELLPLLLGHPGLEVEIIGTPADYREAGDSLRIGVSADEVAGDTDWFDLGVSITIEGRQVPFRDVFLALSRGESHLLLDDGAYFSLGKPELVALAALIAEARALQDAPPDALKISRFQAGFWDELAGLGVIDRQSAAWERQVAGLLSAGGIGDTPVPESLTARLRPYQLAGCRWLALLWQHRLGGILADDMGLGKTLQALALILHAREAEPGAAPFLIVAPTSVVPNWAAEAGRFAPGLKVVAVTETARRRGQPIAEAIAGADAVVTSYTRRRIDFEEYSGQSWSGLILDEAQNAKNHHSKVYQCARRLATPFKVAITGTPMENNLMELWSLLSIAAPGLFPSPDRFREYYAKPIERLGQPELLAQLRRRVKPLLKRRTKEQVAADLPGKQEQVLEVDLHPRHRKLYQTQLQRERQKVLGLIDDMNANRFTILRSLTILRQLSLHGGLVDAAHHDLPSAKIDALIEQLEDVAGGGHRALVFSQFTGFLGKVRERLDAERISYSYLDGGTTNRGAVIERFRAGTDLVFLISLKAGGFGLNLTEADYCFLLDPWWNPATEAQAVDRTHRIGQTRNVMVYRLIARDTIEEKVMALKERKAALFASVLDSGNAFGSALSAEDIRGLFT